VAGYIINSQLSRLNSQLSTLKAQLSRLNAQGLKAQGLKAQDATLTLNSEAKAQHPTLNIEYVARDFTLET